MYALLCHTHTPMKQAALDSGVGTSGARPTVGDSFMNGYAGSGETADSVSYYRMYKYMYKYIYIYIYI